MNRPILLLIVQFSLALCSSGQFSAEQLKASSDRAAAFLKQAQLLGGEIRDSANPLFNIWETILVTNALLDRFPESDPTIQRALNWLNANQNGRQLICHNEKCRDSYCIETSAVYLRLLARLQSKPDLSIPLKAILNLQKPDGSWEIGNPDVLYRTDFPSVTAFTLGLLNDFPGTTEAKDKGYAWLAAQQQKNGSFGQTWEYYNCPGYALWQCMPVLKVQPQYAENWQRGIDFILANQLPDGSWNHIDPEIANRVSPQLQTAFMLSCLVDSETAAGKLAFNLGLQFLLDSQLPNGAWDGGFFPIPNERYKKREYLVATALIFQLLQKTAAHE